MSDELKQLLSGNVEQVASAIATMDAPQLDALEQAEVADSNRKGVLDAVSDRRAKLAAENPATPPVPPVKADKQDKQDKPQVEAWQKPDYAGTLTSGQAKWRNANLKPQMVRAKK